MTRKLAVGLFVLMAAGLVAALSAGSQAAELDSQFTVSFSAGGLKTEPRSLAGPAGQGEAYQILTLDGLDVTQDLGEPCLPVKVVQIYVPRGREVSRVVVESARTAVLPGQYLVMPGQQQVPTSSPAGVAPIAPDPAIYSSSAPYPPSPVALAATGTIGGRRVASIKVFPLQYVPAARRLRLNEEIVFRVELVDAPEPEIPRETADVAALRNSVVAGMVENAADLETDFPATGTLTGPEAVEYLIICHENHVDEYLPLRDWKTRKGVPAAIKTWQEITAAYSGRDYPEKLRNCIKDYYLNHSTAWVVLGGSGAKGLPYLRGCYCDVYGTVDNAIPCDLYFADMDGNWNQDSDGLWGETGDGTDLYPDVYVGRFTANTGVQASIIVTKVLTYEGLLSLPTDYQLRMLFMAEWLDGDTNGAVNKNMIDNESVPARFDPIQKLYESSGNETYSTCMAALNSGKGIVNHDGHGNVTIISIGPGTLSDNDMAALVNGPRYTVFYTLACDPAAYDGLMGCLGKSFLEAPAGGGFFVGNSRYGWYSPGASGYGTGDLFDREFFKSIFIRGFSNLGVIHADAKVRRIPYSGYDDTDRWAQFSLNLLGDPETPVWLDTPKTLAVTHPAETETGSHSFTVAVASGGSPVAQARVCLWKGDDVYLVGQTLAGGSVTLDLAPADTGTVLVTVTKNGYLPYLGSSQVNDGLAGVAGTQGSLRWELAARPNPAVGAVDISFALPASALGADARPQVAVYDAAGRLVASLAVDRAERGRVAWDGKSATGLDVPPGIYFLKMACGEESISTKVVLLR
jgi:hypothetical protein